MVVLARDGDIHVLTMNEGQNLIEPDFVAAMLRALDVVDAASDSAAAGLVLTGEGKFFSNGLNVPAVKALKDEASQAFWSEISLLTRRLLIAPYPVVAAINGHAFAAGAIFALACDYRIMREDRGWLCFSEVDAGVPISRPMMGMIRAKLPPATARDAVITGKRYTADEAIASGFADAKVPAGDLVDRAKKYASELASKDRTIFSELKRTLWADVAEAFT